MKFLDPFLKKDIYHLIKYHWKQFLGVWIIIWFLLFLLNIFIWISSYTSSLSDDLREKLGMYFYIKETPETRDIVYKKVINLQNDLQKQWLKVMFSSKEDAMKFLETKLPDISKNFERFDIENPLPATLYVMFSSHKEYDILKDTLVKYKDIILNIKDIGEWKTIEDQENRMLTIIDVNNFVVFLSLLVVVFLALVIFTFLGYQTHFISQYLRKQLEIKRLLGGTYFSIIKEFLLLNISVLIIGFTLCFGLLIIAWSTLSVSLYKLFKIGLLDIFAQSSTWYVLAWFILEIILFILFSIIASYFVLQKMKK
jgi:cell division protein FtsX